MDGERMRSIPVLDLDAWSHESDDLLVASLAEFGLAHIRGHGIMPGQLDTFYEEFLSILERPVDEKSSWGGENVWFQRGWTPPDTERAAVSYTHLTLPTRTRG